MRSISYIKHGLNFESLFALIWLVVHDQEHLWSGVTLENAMESIVNALYEIQRGGNLSALEDRGVGIGELYSHDDPEVTADQPICSEGSFHKLIESLAGIHRDVEIHFVSTQSMYQKLKRLVVSVLSEWLDKSLKEGESPEALHTHLVRTTDSDVGLSECWGDIQEAVTEQMRLTFGNESATQPLLQDVLAQAEFVVLSRESIQHLLNRIHGSVSTSPLSISGISSPPWTRLGLH